MDSGMDFDMDSDMDFGMDSDMDFRVDDGMDFGMDSAWIFVAHCGSLSVGLKNKMKSTHFPRRIHGTGLAIRKCSA